MEAVGIVVEYNPFHRGHAIHLKKVKEKYPEAVVIGVMSGDYVQRGEAALLCKEKRAQRAKKAGVDIVVELPAFYSTQNAEIFARAAIGILDRMGCTCVIFGSETNNIEKLKELAKESFKQENIEKLQKYLEQGFSYPTASAKAFSMEDLQSNDMLGLEYMKALWFWNSSMKAESILRINANYYEENQEKKVAGASIIREKIKQGEAYREYLEEEETLQEPFLFWEDFYSYFRCYVLFHAKHLKEIQDMEEGLENRILKFLQEKKDYTSFLKAVLTRRYTYARLQRVFLHILLGLTKEITIRWKEEIPYLRILEYSEKGQEYLKQLKKKGVHFLTTKKNISKKLNEEAQEIFFWNEKASKFYQYIIEEKRCRK